MVVLIRRARRLTRRPATLSTFVVWLIVAAAASAPAAAQDPPPLPGHSRGNDSAAVWVVEFADFGCGACAAFTRQSLPLLQSRAIEAGTVRYVVIPFDIGAFRSGTAAAAARCAADQDAFWRMHDLLYERQADWLGRGGQPKRFAGYAAELRLDATRFAACLDDRATRADVEHNNELAKRCRIRGTPTFFINGRRIEGALPTAEFVAAVEAAASARPGARRPDCLG